MVDPDLKLLPLHFCHDPGPSFNWSLLGAETKSPSQDALLDLMREYLDLDKFFPSPNFFSSRQSSSGSDDGSAGSYGSLKKKKDGKSNSVAKQFGSLGKSVGKKLGIGDEEAPFG